MKILVNKVEGKFIIISDQKQIGTEEKLRMICYHGSWFSTTYAFNPKRLQLSHCWTETVYKWVYFLLLKVIILLSKRTSSRAKV